MTLTKNDKLEVVNYCLRVNGRPFIVDYPTETLSHVTEDGRLVTVQDQRYYVPWNPEDIEGYYA